MSRVTRSSFWSGGRIIVVIVFWIQLDLWVCGICSRHDCFRGVVKRKVREVEGGIGCAVTSVRGGGMEKKWLERDEG